MHMTEGLTQGEHFQVKIRTWILMKRPFSLEFLESLRFFLEFSLSKIKGIYKAS